MHYNRGNRYTVVVAALATIASFASSAPAHGSGALSIGAPHQVGYTGTNALAISCPRGIPVSASVCAVLIDVTAHPRYPSLSLVRRGVPSAPQELARDADRVVCASATVCGVYATPAAASGGSNTIEWLRNGTPRSTTTIDGIKFVTDVECPTASRCVAIGEALQQITATTYNFHARLAFVSPRTNTATAEPIPAVNEVADLSCGSPTSCYATGSKHGPVTVQGDARSEFVPAGAVDGGERIVHVTGSKVTVAPVTEPRLGRIACGDATHCIATSYTGDFASGSGWNLLAVTDGKVDDVIRSTQTLDFACWNATDCLGVVGLDHSNDADPDQTAYVAALDAGQPGATSNLPGYDFSGELLTPQVACPTAGVCLIEAARTSAAKAGEEIDTMVVTTS